MSTIADEVLHTSTNQEIQERAQREVEREQSIEEFLGLFKSVTSDAALIAMFIRLKIVVNGPIGSGKTTIVELLKEAAEKNNKAIGVFLERVPIDTLTRFIQWETDHKGIHPKPKNPEAFPLQMSILETRLEDASKALQECKDKIIVFDRSLVGDWEFAQANYESLNFTKEEMRRYMQRYHEVNIWNPDIYVNTDVPFEQTLERIRGRARSNESTYDPGYLRLLYNINCNVFDAIKCPKIKINWTASIDLTSPTERYQAGMRIYREMAKALMPFYLNAPIPDLKITSLGRNSVKAAQDYTTKFLVPVYLGRQQGYYIWLAGPPGSGKSQELINHLTRYQVAKKTCLAIKPAMDTRQLLVQRQQLTSSQGAALGWSIWNPDSPIYPVIGDTRGSIESRAGIDYPCSQVSHLMPLVTNELILKFVDVFGVDEMQFFPDAEEAVAFLLNHGKIIISAGLAADYRTASFGNYSSLVRFANETKTIPAVCVKCGSMAATFAQRTSGEREQIVIGDKYEARCNKCYHHPGLTRDDNIMKRFDVTIDSDPPMNTLYGQMGVEEPTKRPANMGEETQKQYMELTQHSREAIAKFYRSLVGPRTAKAYWPDVDSDFDSEHDTDNLQPQPEDPNTENKPIHGRARVRRAQWEAYMETLREYQAKGRVADSSDTQLPHVFKEHFEKYMRPPSDSMEAKQTIVITPPGVTPLSHITPEVEFMFYDKKQAKMVPANLDEETKKQFRDLSQHTKETIDKFYHHLVDPGMVRADWIGKDSDSEYDTDYDDMPPLEEVDD